MQRTFKLMYYTGKSARDVFPLQTDISTKAALSAQNIRSFIQTLYLKNN
ncbi:MAG: hypothetical protein MI975_05730 [Cytophagales bacterium]|nr:hypothetical protein [Cytophagales bacterium]